MKNKNRLLLANLAFLLFLVSCKDTAIVKQQEQVGNEVMFTTNVISRGAEYNTANVDSLGVFAYFTGLQDFQGTETPDFMYNVLLERQPGQTLWEYSPKQYWTSNNNEKATFVAYSPRVDFTAPNTHGLTITASAAPGLPSIFYSVPEDVEQQPDLLIADPIYNKTRSVVNYNMQHALAQVAFVVSGKGHKVNEIKINGISTYGQVKAQTPIAWEDLNPPQSLDLCAGIEFEPNEDFAFIDLDEPENVLKNDGYLMMIPQTLDDNAKIYVRYDGTKTLEVPLKRSSYTEWEAGRKYSYVIALGREGYDIEPNCYIVPVGDTQTIPFNNVNIFWGEGGDGAIAQYMEDNGISGFDAPMEAFEHEVTGNLILNRNDYITELIWTDTNDTNLIFSNDNNSFDVSGMDEEGNYLIGVRNAGSSDYLWSWHMWVTNYDPAVDFVTYTALDGNVYNLMDRNIGAKSNDNALEAVGVCYQWGRKDPFPRPKTYGVGTQLLMDTQGAHPIEIRNGATSSLLETIKEPFVFYRDGGPIQNGYLGFVTGNTRWGSDRNSRKLEKSLYDPSPDGWRVPWTFRMFPDRSNLNYSFKVYPNGEAADPSWGTSGRAYYLEVNNHIYPFTGRIVYRSNEKKIRLFTSYRVRLHLGSPAKDSSTGNYSKGNGLDLDNKPDNITLHIDSITTPRQEALNVRAVHE